MKGECGLVVVKKEDKMEDGMTTAAETMCGFMYIGTAVRERSRNERKTRRG